MIRFNVAQWHNAELMAFFKGLFRQDSLSELQQQLEQYYQRKVLLLNSARSGIRLALRYAAMQQPTRRLVLYPEYICSSVPQAISEAGFVGKAVAVTPELNMCPQAVKAEMPEAPLAVILPHMYGVAADIVNIQSICRQHQVMLIDDAAQVAGISLNGQLLGTFGDFGVISFAQAKTIVTGVQGSGGVLLYPNDSKLSAQLKPTSGWHRLWPLWHFWASYQQDGLASRFDYYLQRLLQVIRKKRGLAVAPRYQDGYAMAAPDAAVALRQFATLSARINILQQQATLAATVLSTLQHLKFPQLQAGRYLTRLIVQSPAVAPHELATLCEKYGIKTKTTYGHSSKTYNGSHTSGLLELPWQGLSETDVVLMFDQLQKLDQEICDRS